MRGPRAQTARGAAFALLVLAVSTLATLLVGARVLAAPPSQSPDEGWQLMQTKGCVSCHTLGEGDRVGPDLQGVTARRTREWLTNWLLAPDKLLAQQDPSAVELLKQYKNVPMPNLGLTQGEVAALIAYLENPALGSGAQAPVEALPVGDPAAGKTLFTGARRFKNGGPPCLACHSVAGIGALGGGALGPDLTSSFGKYKAIGMQSILQTFPFPTMNPVWRDHPLTPEERADLTAFLQSAGVAGRSGSAVGVLALLAALGVTVVFGIAQLVWRRRLNQVRRPMVMRRAFAPKTSGGQ